MVSAKTDFMNEGAMTASLARQAGSRGNEKATLEHLYDAGLVAIAGRRRFERLYDLTERIITNSALDARMPPREEAMKQLIEDTRGTAKTGGKSRIASTFREVEGDSSGVFS